MSDILGAEAQKRLRNLAAENRRREGEALRLFRPMETQMPFLISEASERIIRGGVRGGKTILAAAEVASAATGIPLTGADGNELPFRYPTKNGHMVIWCHDKETEVLTREGWKLFSDLSGREELGTVNLETDTLEFHRPSRITAESYAGNMVRINGQQRLDMLVTPEHRMVVYPHHASKAYSDGAPVIREARGLQQQDKLKLSVANYAGTMPRLPEFLGDIEVIDFAEWLGFYFAEGCCSRSTNGNGYCHWKVMITQIKPEGIRYYEDLISRLQFKWHRTKKDFVICSKKLWEYLKPLGDCYTKSVPQWVKDAPQDVIRAFLKGYFKGDGSERADGHIYSYSVSKDLTDGIQELLLRVGKSASVKLRPAGEYEFKKEGRKGVRREGYWLSVWTTQTATLRNLIPSDGKRTSILYETVPNYDDKVYCATVPNGTLITRRNGKPIISGNCIGYNQKHIARIYKYLFTSGHFTKFRILKDPKTGELRSWRPWDPEDAKLEHLTKPHPPMIPRRFCPVDSPPGDDGAGIAYENKGERIFSLAKLTNGTEIYAFSSGGRAGMGVAVDLIWIDEDVEYPQYVAEWQSRLSDVKGKLIWSAWPWADNDALALMSQRAEDESKEEKPDVSEIVLQFSKNPYMPPEEIIKRRKAWAAEGDGTLRARDLGEFLTGLTLVFPNFDIDVHGIPSMANDKDPLDKILARYNYRIPKEWTHYLGVDPGFAHMALVLAAVPPPEIGDYFIVYDEIYLKRAVPADAIRELLRKAPKQKWHAFIMDDHMGRQTQTAGKTVRQQWTEAFEKAGLRSRLTYSSFMPGSDNIFARNLVVRRSMDPRSDGTTRFRLFREKAKTGYMQREFARYRRTVTKDETTEKTRASHNHLMDANAYIMASEPIYYIPPLEEREKSAAFRTIEQLRGRNKKDRDANTIYMGAGKAPAFTS